MRIASAMLLVGVLSVAGCATSPAYVNSVSAEAASIDGDVANFFKYFGGQAHVRVAEIDGARIAGIPPYRVTPGVHEFGIMLQSDGQMANMYVKADLQSRKKYKLAGEFSGISAKARLLDVTNESSPVVVEEYKEKQTPVTKTVTNTIVVPVYK